ncbi:MAG: hypothetical protein AAF431_06290 [Pseudomonadota bacterium]
MKKSHRTTHRVIWILLLPLLLGFVYMAQQEEPAKPTTIEQAPSPSAVGELP